MRSFNRAWAVPRNERPNPIALRLRSLLLLLVLGAGVLVTTTLSGLTTDAGAFGATVSAGFGIAAIPLTTLVNVGLFMVAFRVLTASEVPARHLHIVAVVAGIGRQIVQVLGTYLVAHTLRGAPEAYGVVGLVLGLIAWIYQLALVIVFAAETNVVAPRRLWPRALLTPLYRPGAADLGRRARLHGIRRERAPQGVRDSSTSASSRPKKRPTPTTAARPGGDDRAAGATRRRSTNTRTPAVRGSRGECRRKRRLSSLRSGRLAAVTQTGEPKSALKPPAPSRRARRTTSVAEPRSA